MTAGSLVFETAPLEPWRPANVNVQVRPSDYPGYYQGYFRIFSDTLPRQLSCRRTELAEPTNHPLPGRSVAAACVEGKQRVNWEVELSDGRILENAVDWTFIR